METSSENAHLEGIIKFQYDLTKETSPATIIHYDDIEFYRRLLYPTGVIGFDPKERVGYGNLSKRHRNTEFIITASQTGELPELVTKHYVHVKDCHIENQTLKAIGMKNPSSESLTHYAIYETKPEINHVFHGHHEGIWHYLIKNNYPCIHESIPYGTLEMAKAVSELIQKEKLVSGIFAMKGHKNGFVSYADEGRKASRNIKRILKLLS